MKDLGDILRAWAVWRPRRTVLATLVRVRGSSYRRPGARMLIGESGCSVGSLSGGCLEAEVVERAGKVAATGACDWITFDTRRRFGCHGAIEIFLEPGPDQLFDELAQRLQGRHQGRLATCFGGEQLGTRWAEPWEESTGEIMVCEVDPPLRLLIIGDGPDSAALRAIAAVLGWEVEIMEDASEWRGVADARTAAVVKTHNFGRDFAALRTLLPLGLRYVGLVGPRLRRDQLVGDLLDTGCDPGGRLYGPAGLHLGGDGPEAIALAVAAEIQAVFAAGTGEPLRTLRAPIHAAPSPASILPC